MGHEIKKVSWWDAFQGCTILVRKLALGFSHCPSEGCRGPKYTDIINYCPGRFGRMGTKALPEDPHFTDIPIFLSGRVTLKSIFLNFFVV